MDEDGKEINPHIPQFMASAPWYLNHEHPGLKHQKAWNPEKKDSGQWYERGAKGHQATKYRKGACENCGAMTHKTRDCLERPRARGAKLTGKNIAADEKVQTLEGLTFAGKRDRWNGYDAKEYAKVQDRHAKIEALKQAKAKERELAAKFGEGPGGKGQEGAGEPSTSGKEVATRIEDDAKVGEGEITGFAKVEVRVRSAGGGASGTVRNLRIREDTAKYLLNLDTNSAYYDPKSRSMRADPNPDKPAHEKNFAGDNANLRAGDYSEWQRTMLHAQDAFAHGDKVNMLAAPSQAEKLYDEFKKKKEKLLAEKKSSVVDRYGNAAAEAGDEERKLLLGQTEAYVEYDRAGRLIKGDEEPTALSRYEENVLVNNHTAVWGSYWSQGRWGFACCHSSVRNSFCTGEAGKAAAREAAEAVRKGSVAQAQEPEGEEGGGAGAGAPDRKAAAPAVPGAAAWGAEVDPDVNLDPAKLKRALAAYEDGGRAKQPLDERKRAYNSLAADGSDGTVTAEEMEAWRLKRARADDPLARPGGGGEGGEGGPGGSVGGYDLV